MVRESGGIICDKHVLSDRYHVILPVLDGHGEGVSKNIGPQNTCTGNLSSKEQCDGHVFHIEVVFFGGQIVMSVR